MTLRLTESQESVATELVSEPAGAGYDTCEEKNDFYCYWWYWNIPYVHHQVHCAGQQAQRQDLNSLEIAVGITQVQFHVSAIRHWLTGLIWNEGVNQTLSQIHGRLHSFNFCSHEYFKPLEPDDIPIYK